VSSGGNGVSSGGNGASGGSALAGSGATGRAGAGGSSGAGAGAGAGGANTGAGGAGSSCQCHVGRTCVANTCLGGWVAAKAPPLGLVARSRAASVALGKSVFIWGGQDSGGNALDNGAIYDPVGDSWTFLPRDTGAPSARIMATAVWTGKVVIVYGGTDAAGTTVFSDGASYDPGMNSWSPLPSSPPPSPRSAPFAFWDGTRAIFWGGVNATGNVSGADRFDLKTWSVSSTTGDPGPLLNPALGFNGSVIYMQGGWLSPNPIIDKVYSYTSSTDKWSVLAKSLSPRVGAFGTWDGARFVVWGGRSDTALLGDGSYLSGSTWTPVATLGAPGPRYSPFRRSGWSFSVRAGVLAIMGGQVSLTGNGELATNGATYDVGSSQWTAIASWPSAEAHEFGMGVWTGEEFLVWGGRDANGPTLTGERWAP
jgi:Kelch motif